MEIDVTRWSITATLVVLVFHQSLSKWHRMRQYFKRLNLASPTPLPLVGNFLSIIRNGYPKHDREIIKKYGKIAGCFEGPTPIIYFTDIKLVQHVLIKDFASFTNRRTVDGVFKAPFDKFLTSLKNDEWRTVRRIASPTFTTGKLKHMFQYVNSCSDNLMFLLKATADNDQDFNPKEIFGCYTLDVISSCCFGIDSDSINNPNTDFLKHLKLAFKNTFTPNLKILFLLILPRMAIYLSNKGVIDFFCEESLRYISETVNQIILRRKARLEKRNDFIQHMIEHELEPESSSASANDKEAVGGDESIECNMLNEPAAHSSSRKTLTNSEIVSQAILFFFAGYETSALTTTFTAYNLAMHPECQKRLCQEVDQVMQEHSEITYEALKSMKFMSMVIDETMRLYPPASRIERVANEDFDYNGLKIAKGQILTIPLHALHYDEDFYPEPDKFDPERFSESQKQTRPNEAFMPFGAGPRHCLGARLAIMEIKAILTKILSKYEFVPSDKTPATLNLSKTKLTQPNGPLFIKLRPRSKIR